MQGAPPFDPGNTLAVWFTDTSAHLKNLVWFRKSTAISADGKAELTEEIKGSAQSAESLAITRAFEAGASTVYTDSAALSAGATQCLGNGQELLHSLHRRCRQGYTSACVLPGRTRITAVPSSLTWYLGPALLPSQDLRKAINNCTCDQYPQLPTPGNTVSRTNAI